MQELPTLQEIEKVSRIFKLLSDATRLKILLTLEQGERNVTSIAEVVQMEQSAVSHQLKLLKDNRMVKARREGKTVFYRLDDQHVFDILEETLEHTRH
ncbi:MAG: winged helix-turn-helix transcriptional regulator [Enterococcus sp.]|uniref:Metalloregulator ArsR/SmtB family transcription factor n=1 Tax=Enterococcus aquimarinus TaxID=328396 RepID=A0A9E3ZV26_9ENTE|nr:winged helix-turn-helix transcriptional regulator [Enterococcus sp.]MCC9274568.1 metalloregulator ArsR/SmtB family transcription factor [Enterococcus aquimarinus]MBP7085961.1 winged helix-turn-helix transcriptional regulator [Enterococcus sp.]MBP7953331.1 winged helix-turn-helix transcriptional regulator [Enterococcus sp.]MBP8693160.1 winged helix-turn-helix transcriptional regulator [Enterococcus sp.]